MKIITAVFMIFSSASFFVSSELGILFGILTIVHVIDDKFEDKP